MKIETEHLISKPAFKYLHIYIVNQASCRIKFLLGNPQELFISDQMFYKLLARNIAGNCGLHFRKKICKMDLKTYNMWLLEINITLTLRVKIFVRYINLKEELW